MQILWSFRRGSSGGGPAGAGDEEANPISGPTAQLCIHQGFYAGRNVIF